LGLCEQLRRYAEHRTGCGKPLVERMHRGAVGRRRRKVQGITGAQGECVLIDELRCRTEMRPVTDSTVKLSATSLLNIAIAAARCFRVICPVRSLIAMTDDISVTVQSLISSCAGSCCASQP
jgi:hypothetical protein